MKKIAHILYSGLGGHGSVVFSYLNGAYLDSFDHHIIFFGVEEILPEYIMECEKRNIEYSYVKKLGLIKSTRNLYRELKNVNPGLIISHSLPTSIVLLLHKITSSSRSIMVEHTPIQFKRTIDILWSTLSTIIAEKIIFLTPKAQKESPRIVKLFLSDSKVCIIPNGIDTMKFSSVENKNKIHVPLIISHGRLVPQKDFDTMFKGLSRLAKKGFEFKVVIAGDGELEDDLKNTVKKLDIDSYVTFAGRLDEDRLIELLQKANIYINSSVAETMSTAILQALSSELLCLVSDIDENILLVKDGVTGYTFKVRNDADLANKLEMTYEHDWSEIAKTGRNFILENYSSIRMADNYKQITEAALNI